MDYDLKIVGGTIIDGSGKPGFRGDLGISQGKVAAIGKVPGTARKTIEADGRAVSPGFVDIHTHYDAQVMWDRMMTISPWHGVTTAVIGNCGFGVAPTRPLHRELILRTLEKVEGMSYEALEAGLGQDWPFETFPEYLDALEDRGTAINVGALLGHTPLRLYVMGEAATERAATADEVAQMQRLVREGMAAGAVGFATSKATTHNGFGGRPVPSRAAELSEILTLAGTMREFGRGLTQLTIGPGFFLDQMAEISRASGRPVSWTALLTGLAGPGSHRKMLQRNAALVQEGLQIVPQVSCRPLNFEFTFMEPFPFETMPLFTRLMVEDRASKMRTYGDPDFRRAFNEQLSRVMAGWWDRAVISFSTSDHSLDEQPLALVAGGRGQHPVDFALDLSIREQLETKFRLAVVNVDEDEVQEVLTHPTTVIGLSDAGAHANQLCDACFSTHLLGRWVREKGTLALEDAVRMLTSRPAEVFGIADRGLLAVGRPADVVVFDPATVGASKLKRVHDLPAGADRLLSEGIGIDAVVVNGTMLRRAGQDQVDPKGPLPGKLLRGGAARA